MAARAAMTAASTSLDAPRAMTPICCPVDGFSTASVCPDSASCHFPLIYSCVGSNHSTDIRSLLTAGCGAGELLLSMESLSDSIHPSTTDYKGVFHRAHAEYASR